MAEGAFGGWKVLVVAGKKNQFGDCQCGKLTGPLPFAKDCFIFNELHHWVEGEKKVTSLEVLLPGFFSIGHQHGFKDAPVQLK